MNYAPRKNFSSLLDETILSAQNHVDFIVETISLYDKTQNDFLVLICDNCETTKAVSDILKLPMVGCPSHRFNLAVNDILEKKTGNYCENQKPND